VLKILSGALALGAVWIGTATAGATAAAFSALALLGSVLSLELAGRASREERRREQRERQGVWEKRLRAERDAVHHVVEDERADVAYRARQFLEDVSAAVVADLKAQNEAYAAESSTADEAHAVEVARLKEAVRVQEYVARRAAPHDAWNQDAAQHAIAIRAREILITLSGGHTAIELHIVNTSWWAVTVEMAAGHADLHVHSTHGPGTVLLGRVDLTGWSLRIGPFEKHTVHRMLVSPPPPQGRSAKLSHVTAAPAFHARLDSTENVPLSVSPFTCIVDPRAPHSWPKEP
jgi:hypothetical protein